MRSDQLDRAFIEAGVTQNDITTRAYARVKEAIAEHPDIIIGETFGDALKEAARLTETLKKQCGTARENAIADRDRRDAVNCFSAALHMVRETFGAEAMTEAVICKAIEAGSFIAYRAIMGEAAQGGRKY